MDPTMLIQVLHLPEAPVAIFGGLCHMHSIASKALASVLEGLSIVASMDALHRSTQASVQQQQLQSPTWLHAGDKSL